MRARLLLRGVLIAVAMLFVPRLGAIELRNAEIRHAEVIVDWSGFRADLTETSTIRSGTNRIALVSPPIVVPIPSPEPFLAVTAVWAVEHAQPAKITVGVRGSLDGVVWTDWEGLPPDADASTGSESVGGLLFLAKETNRVQFRITLQGGTGATSTLTSFRGVFISPGGSPPAVVGPPTGSPALAEVAKPPVVTRAGWGCPDGQSSPAWTPRYTTVTHLIVHHTVNSNTAGDWAAVVRSIFALHKYTNGWGDIGYNYLVDSNGVVYEGRAGGDDVIGAHFTCANSNTMGVAFLGTFTSVLPSVTAWDSVAQLLAWKAEQRGIDPEGSTYHPSTQMTLPNIAGHRDGNATTAPSACPKGTECPGDALYAMLPALRDDVAALIPLPPPAITVTAPNGGEAWLVGLPHFIAWVAENLDPSGEVRVFLSRDGGTTLDPDPIATVDPETTWVAWTPASTDVGHAAKFFVGSFVDGDYEVSDWSDGSFMIINRRRPFRRPGAE